MRERPPSAYISTIPPRSKIVWAVMNASWSRWPRRTGNTPPWLMMKSITGGLKSCDFAMKCTSRRSSTATKKWSQKLKWLGAIRTGPRAGTFATSIAR